MPPDVGKEALLVGPDARLQLVARTRHQSGQVRDATNQAEYQVEPLGIVRVDSAGRVFPLANGSAMVKAIASLGVEASVKVTVERFDDPPEINFPNEVVPIFTKLECNGGGCHGKSGGQNGFALSLLGFEPRDDYTRLISEARGRRVFPAAPDRSLLLTKPAR